MRAITGASCPRIRRPQGTIAAIIAMQQEDPKQAMARMSSFSGGFRKTVAAIAAVALFLGTMTSYGLAATPNAEHDHGLHHSHPHHTHDADADTNRDNDAAGTDTAEVAAHAHVFSILPQIDSLPWAPAASSFPASGVNQLLQATVHRLERPPKAL